MVCVPLRMGTGYRAIPHGSTCMGTPQETENNTASGSGILGWESGVLLGLEDWMQKTDTSKALICVPHLGPSDWHRGCSRAETTSLFRAWARESCGDLLALVESWKFKSVLGALEDQTQNHQGPDVWFLPSQPSVCLRMRHARAAVRALVPTACSCTL